MVLLKVFLRKLLHLHYRCLNDPFSSKSYEKLNETLRFLIFFLFIVSKTIFYKFYCPPPFQRKVEGHCFWFSMGRGAEFLVGTLSP